MRAPLTLLTTCALALAACGSDTGSAGPGAEDRPVTADFPEVYRAGGSDAPGWAQFSRQGPVSFDGSGNLYVLDPFPDAFGPDGLVAYWEVDELDVPTIVVKWLPEGVR